MLLFDVDQEPKATRLFNVKEDTKRYIENYKKENKDIIKRNRTRPSASQTFYECELERESILREKREREEEEEEGQPEALKPTSASDDPTTSMVTESEGEKRKSLVPPTPRTNMLIPPASSFGRRPPTTFVPPSISAPPSYIVPPTQGVGYAPSSAFPARSLVTPVSGLMAPPSMFPVAPPTGSSSNDWLSRPRHAVRLPHMQSVRKQQDTVLIPSQHTSQNTKQEANEANRFVYEPYQVELCGPTPPLPSNQHTRWNDILEMYENTIIANLPRQTRSPLYSPDIKPNFEAEHDYKVDDYNIEASDIKPTCNPETGFLKTEYDSENDHHVEGMISKTEDPAKETKRLGLSHKLNVGACGIAPAVFIERCLMESRCGLFI
ncbi:unnamed protein product [Trichobilharzia szidati]|nr:unnamed protein product [Trichobilharzia szidati]